MTKSLVAEQNKVLEKAAVTNLEYWPLSVRNNPRREMDLPRLAVPLFGPLGPAYVEDPYDPAGTAD